jgi:hypothetical protein
MEEEKREGSERDFTEEYTLLAGLRSEGNRDYHALSVRENNVLGTLGILFAIKERVPETCLIKLGTLGEYVVMNRDIVRENLKI